MKKWIISIIILVILIGGGSWYFVKSKQNQLPVMAATSTASVQKGNLEVKISGSGSIVSSSSKDVESDVMAEVDEVLVSKNDTVSKGDELVTFTDGSDPITAPNSGTITTLDVENGDKVTEKQVVAHITNYKTLQSTISIDELDISSVKVGQSAEITASAFPDDTFTGKVSSVAKEGEATNGVSTFEVTVKIDDPKNLKVGMSTEANILTASKKDALYIPVEAVRTNGEKKYVLVQGTSNQEDSSSTQVEVETGIHNDSYVEITSGLQENQQVELPAIAKSSSGNQNNFEGKMNGMGRMPSGGMMPGGMNGGSMGNMNRGSNSGGGGK